MRPIMSIIYFEDSYGFPEREVVVFKESRIGPAPKEIDDQGLWEYFEVHEPVDLIRFYGINEDGFLFGLTDSTVQLVSERECKIGGKWYSRSERLKQKL